MDICVIKLPNGCLAGYGEEAQEELAKVKTGCLMNVKATRVRNYLFHRKLFALWNILFDIWSETAPKMTYKGQEVLPNFTRFRQDMTILAGFYDATVNLNGDVRLEAKSISFASMDQTEFEALYSAMIGVGLTKVITRTKMSESDLRDTVDRVLSFDS